jgi:ABC-type multidrug transport system ATPase subunit
MIINKGKSITVGTPDDLRDRIAANPKIEIKLKKLSPAIIEAAKNATQVKQVDADSLASKLTIILDDVQLGTPQIVKDIVEADGLILSVNVVRPSLEEAYLKLIKEEQK